MADETLYDYFSVVYFLRGVEGGRQRTYKVSEPVSANRAVTDALVAFKDRPPGSDWISIDGGGFARADDVVAIFVEPLKSPPRSVRPAVGRPAEPLSDPADEFWSYPD